MSFLDKLFHAGRAQLNEFGNAALSSRPDAVRHLDQEEAVKRLTAGNEADAQAIKAVKPKLDAAAGQLRAQSRQLQDEETEIAELNAKLDAALQEEANVEAQITRLDSVTDSAKIVELTKEKDSYTEAARALNTSLSHANETHAVTQKEFAQNTGFVTKARQDVAAATKRIADRQKHAQDLGQKLEMTETIRTARETARDVGQINLAGVGAASSKAEKEIQDMIDVNMASTDNDDAFNVPADPTQSVIDKLDVKIASRKGDSDLDARRAKLGLKASPQTVNA